MSHHEYKSFGKLYFAIDQAFAYGYITQQEHETCIQIRKNHPEIVFVQTYPETFCATCDAPECFTFYMYDDLYLHMCVPCILKRYEIKK